MSLITKCMDYIIIPLKTGSRRVSDSLLNPVYDEFINHSLHLRISLYGVIPFLTGDFPRYYPNIRQVILQYVRISPIWVDFFNPDYSGKPPFWRFEPSSRNALIGEQPNPWERLHPQDASSRHRNYLLFLIVWTISSSRLQRESAYYRSLNLLSSHALYMTKSLRGHYPSLYFIDGTI